MRRLSPQSVEIDRIYLAMHNSGCRTFAVTASSKGEGVSMLSKILAEKALLAGHSTILVDLNVFHPTLIPKLSIETNESLDNLLGTPQLVCTENNQDTLLGITTPQKRDIIAKLHNPGELERSIEQLKARYDTIIFDASSVSQNKPESIPAERVAAACDGTLLVVLSGKTTEAMVNTTIEKLKCVDARILGCIINDKHTPTLKRELIRESRRLPQALKEVSKWIERNLRKSRLLSLEV